ncbi:DUF6398 domain-containing protein [Flavobacterium sp.]|jgi:hypothetical protein|uniref:DUF6398 domain-containing protein n=1 Tax=Flavobacterium sp. TaxID=239 RepID=UPI0037C0F157
MTKQEIKEKEAKLLEITGAFCAQKLDDEYFYLCEKLIKKMGRKRDVPFQRGKLEIWAAAIVHAIGSINFLFDKSFKPYITSDQISEYFETKNSTVSNKAREIRDMFNLSYYSPEFSTQKMNGSNPFNNMVMVDGFIVPLSTLPDNLQQQVREARAIGRDIEFSTR